MDSSPLNKGSEYGIGIILDIFISIITIIYCYYYYRQF